jgi:hypothetical protein
MATKTKPEVEQGKRANLKKLVLKVSKEDYAEISALGNVLGLTAFTLGLSASEAKDALMKRAQEKGKESAQ